MTPCVLPLVPGYLSAISAVEADRLGERGVARRVVVARLPFILGFTVVFVVLGAAAAAIGGVVNSDRQLEIAGFVLVVLGLALHGRPAVAGADRRAGAARRARDGPGRACCSAVRSQCARRRASAPCSLGSSSLAADSRTVVRGSLLLVAYSAGLGFAFLLAGVAFARAMSVFRWLRDHYLLIQRVSGATLVVLGLLLFFHRDWWLRVALNRVLDAVGLGLALEPRRRQVERAALAQLAELRE